MTILKIYLSVYKMHNLTERIRENINAVKNLVAVSLKK